MSIEAKSAYFLGSYCTRCQLLEHDPPPPDDGSHHTLVNGYRAIICKRCIDWQEGIREGKRQHRERQQRKAERARETKNFQPEPWRPSDAFGDNQ